MLGALLDLAHRGFRSKGLMGEPAGIPCGALQNPTPPPGMIPGRCLWIRGGVHWSCLGRVFLKESSSLGWGAVLES